MKYFGTDGIRDIAGKGNLSKNIIYKISEAIAKYIKNKKLNTVLIGKDTRISGDFIYHCLSANFNLYGINVFNLGTVPTPTVSYLIEKKYKTIGIVISASHNPYEDNGIKLFNYNGEKLSDKQEKLIEKYIDSKISLPQNFSESIGVSDEVNLYKKYILKLFKKLPLKISVDCANGSYYKIAPEILNQIFSRTFIYNNKPDGKNINKRCGALYLEFIKNKIKKDKPDFGISFDGDGDRCLIVTKNNRVLDGDDILFLNSVSLQKQKRLKSKQVVVTVMTNLGFDSLMKKYNIKVIRTPVGDRNVANAIKKYKAFAGGEQSGHIIFNGFSKTGDGVITALNTIKNIYDSGIDIEAKLKEFYKLPQKLINFKVKKKIPVEQMPEFNKEMKLLQKKLKKTGRIFFRYSGTENKARLLIEAMHQEQIDEYTQVLLNKLKKYI